MIKKALILIAVLLGLGGDFIYILQKRQDVQTQDEASKTQTAKQIKSDHIMRKASEKNQRKLELYLYLQGYKLSSTPLIITLENVKKDEETTYIKPFNYNNHYVIKAKPGQYMITIYPPLNKDQTSYDISKPIIANMDYEDHVFYLHYKRIKHPDPANLSDMGDYISQNYKHKEDTNEAYKQAIDDYTNIISTYHYLTKKQKKEILKHYDSK